MALISKPKTFVAGTVGLSADVNSDFDTIYADYNGNITNANIASAAAIADSKLAQITTASKVSGAAITLLASVPSAAGFLPAANGGLQSDTKDINPTNLLSNGDFECWSLGAALAPDGWVLDGAGATIARGASTPDPKMGTYYAEVTRVGANCLIYQDYGTAKGLAYFVGRPVTFGCWVWASVADRARLSLTGTANTFSSYHTGDSTWQWLTVTKTIDTSTLVYCQVDTGNTTAYFDGAMCVEGSSAFAFSPKPAEEGVWADYFATSTIVGWAASPTGYINTKKIGKTVFVIYSITGTSNANNATFTVPYTASSITGVWKSRLVEATDNTSTDVVNGNNQIAQGSSTVACYRDKAGTLWTTSGTKTVSGQFFYESA